MSRKSAQQSNDYESDSAILPTLPKGWCWTTLETIAEIEGGITKDQKRKRTNTTREVPYLRVANVQRGYLDLEEIKTILADENDVETLRLQRGDVLFTEGGDRDKLGRGWVWNDEIPDCIYQNYIFRARPRSDEFSSRFISLHGNFFGQEWFIRTGKQTTIKAAEAAIDHGLARAARLRQGILKRAFSDQLVAQDPHDEPASALLDQVTQSNTPNLRRRGAPRAKQTT